MRINPNNLKKISLTKVKSKSYLISDQLIFDKYNNAYSYTKSSNNINGKKTAYVSIKVKLIKSILN